MVVAMEAWRESERKVVKMMVLVVEPQKERGKGGEDNEKAVHGAERKKKRCGSILYFIFPNYRIWIPVSLV